MLVANYQIKQIAATNPEESSRLAKEKKAVKTFALVFGLMELCWLPFTINTMYVTVSGFTSTSASFRYCSLRQQTIEITKTR